MKFIYTLLFTCLSLFSWSQSSSIDNQLSKSYSKDEIAQFRDENSLPLYAYAIEHACYLIDAPQGKDVANFKSIQLSKNPAVPMEISNEPIVFTDFGLQILDQTQYFLVTNTNKILVVKSKNILQLEMQNHKK